MKILNILIIFIVICFHFNENINLSCRKNETDTENISILDEDREEICTMPINIDTFNSIVNVIDSSEKPTCSTTIILSTCQYSDFELKRYLTRVIY